MKSIAIMIYLSVLFLSITSGLVSGGDARTNSSHVFSTMEPPVSVPIVVENLSADCDGVVMIPVNFSRTTVPASDVGIVHRSSGLSVDSVSSGVVYGEVRSFSFDGAPHNASIARTSLSLEPDITSAGGNVTVLQDMLPEMFKVKSVEPKSAEQEPVYEVIATKEARILGLVPVSMDIEMEVDASNGEIEVTKKPWWGFLCSGCV